MSKIQINASGWWSSMTLVVLVLGLCAACGGGAQGGGSDEGEIDPGDILTVRVAAKDGGKGGDKSAAMDGKGDAGVGDVDDDPGSNMQMVDSCGDGVCSADENCESCLADCGCAEDEICIEGSCGTCGNGVCDGGESCESCGRDCGMCECEVEALDVENCGMCGERERLCEDGQWGAWQTCAGEGSCTPGEIESEPCGDCGTRNRVCGDDCQWGSWSACGGVGECSPGDVESAPCGNCGTQTRQCTNSCGWGPWQGCSGEGVCAPGTQWVNSCAAGCGTTTQTCSRTCSWSAPSACQGAKETFNLINNWNVIQACSTQVFGYAYVCDAGGCDWISPNNSLTYELSWGQSRTLTYQCCNVDPGLCYPYGNTDLCTIGGAVYDCTCSAPRSITVTANVCPAENLVLCN